MLRYSTEVSENQSQHQRIVNLPLLRRLIANVSVWLVMAFRPMCSSTSIFSYIFKNLNYLRFLIHSKIQRKKYKALALKEETHTT